MKQNPYLPALVFVAVLLVIAGVVAFLVAFFAALSPASTSLGATASSIAALAFPGGVLTFLLWLTASAIAWRPADEPPRRD